MAGGEAHSHVGKQKLINGTQLSYIISLPCINTLLAVRAGDLASFYNIPIEQAFNKIRSGMSGTVMPLRKLGIDMTVATLSAHALTMGITAKWKTLNSAQKSLIRYNYLMKVTAKQQGDFAQTFYTFANQQGYSEQLWLQITGAIAKNFLPILDVLLIVWNKMLEGFLNFGLFVKQNSAILLYFSSIIGGVLIANIAKMTWGIIS